MKKINRRTLLKWSGLLTVSAVAPSVWSKGGVNKYEYSGAASTFSHFLHGVASGDPTVNSAIIWTRVTTEETAPLVYWEVALDDSFEQIVSTGYTQTDESKDFTVKLDVTELNFGRDYVYRFKYRDQASPVGRLRLVPESNTDISSLKFIVTSCSHFEHGEFVGYRDMVEREQNIDAVIHLGDYSYASSNSGDYRKFSHSDFKFDRESYRARYSEIRKDAFLQQAHQMHTWMVIWDDGDLRNGVWREGPAITGADFNEAMDIAMETFFLWMPIRYIAPKRIWRSVPYGDLADIFFMDMCFYDRDIPINNMPDNLNKRQPIFEQYDFPGRSIIGQEQAAWFEQAIRASTARWRIVCSGAPVFEWWDNYSPSAWRAYPQSYKWLLSLFSELDNNIVVLSGGLHKAMAAGLALDPFASDYTAGRDNVAVEITAPSLTRGDGGALWYEIADNQSTEKTLKKNPHMKFRKGNRAGYLITKFEIDQFVGRWRLYEDVRKVNGPKADTYGDIVSEYGKSKIKVVD
ncbi:alkaline phosphatase D family protein [Microbulbifer variabilis]|uniref:alkaline phosphatase D family protein n=1 Tax=Microbulbifer variabilis TaxID=266805 RepID=UPI001CFD5211|nr:alkaline phosphatase D family protein [Microbulbifer variabilis]